ncbi:hypothetical protein NQZ68_035262 [Dissostichus eleginoides]|nr:hypothetical protein NQZ68_035262 [Dissostichus eleginoides]
MAAISKWWGIQRSVGMSEFTPVIKDRVRRTLLVTYSPPTDLCSEAAWTQEKLREEDLSHSFTLLNPENKSSFCKI